jgi:hypothetical protein
MSKFIKSIKSQNLERNIRVQKLLKLLCRKIEILDNNPNAKFDYASLTFKNWIMSEVKFLENIIDNSDKNSNSKVELDIKEYPVQLRLCNIFFKISKEKKINNNHLKTIENGKF